MTMTLVEFLEARLAEDEAAARAASGHHWHLQGIAEIRSLPSDAKGAVEPYWRLIHSAVGVDAGVNGPHIARHDPARVLREVEAKRAIVAAMGATADVEGGGYEDSWHEALRHLAAVYADHDDYDPAWRP